MAAPRGDAAVMRVPRGSPAAVAGPGPVKRRSREEALPGRGAPARSPVPGAQALGSLCSRLQHWVRRDTGRAYYYDSSVTALAILYHAW